MHLFEIGKKLQEVINPWKQAQAIPYYSFYNSENSIAIMEESRYKANPIIFHIYTMSLADTSIELLPRMDMFFFIM